MFDEHTFFFIPQNGGISYKVKKFLEKTLKLEMSDEKTKITHTGDRARFLGYDVTVSRDQTLKKTANGKVQRTQERGG